jgi:hypothetical protein
MKLRTIFGLASGFAAACTTNQAAPPISAEAEESCQMSDLATVIADPIAYDGQLFCGAAVLVSDRFVAFYPRIPQSDEERYGTVLIPKVSKTQVAQLVRIGSGKTFRIKGRLQVDRDCLTGQSLCTPVKRPIALADFSFEPPN